MSDGRWGDGERAAERRRMVERQLRARDVSDELVLAAMEKVPRHRFVPPSRRSEAYGDHALPIDRGQTVSQPYVVAKMTELLELEGGERVLEVGTGSGYQTAVLAEIAGEVYSIEVDDELSRRAGRLLEELGHDVELEVGDGYRGWPEAAPFAAIVVTAAAPRLPEPLLEQLAPGGRLVVPLGVFDQRLVRLTRRDDGFDREEIFAVRFVPMTGEVEAGEA